MIQRSTFALGGEVLYLVGRARRPHLRHSRQFPVTEARGCACRTMLISIVDELQALKGEAGGYTVRMVAESGAESERGSPVFETQIDHMDRYVTCHTESDTTTTRSSDAIMLFAKFLEALERYAAEYPDYGLCWVSALQELGDADGHQLRAVSPVLGWLVRPEYGEVVLVRQDFPEVEE